MAIIAMHNAATGLRALSTQLDVIANNLANANNDGFKSSRVNFEDILYQSRAQAGVQNAQADMRPTGIEVGLGVKVSGTQTNWTQGAAVETGQEMDMMIQGDGLFQVRVLNTQGDGIAYTRTGRFFRNANGEMVLNSGEGYKIDPPITFPANTTAVDVSNDGRVFATIPGQTNPQEVGQIQLARFANPQGLKQIGGNLYQQTEASGTPTLNNPGTDGAGTIIQKYLEASNVDTVSELINLIKTQRTFEMNSKSVQAADDMLQTIGNLKR